ncbi:MAG: hypothetical protein ABR981_05360 [Candidatus Micrarchaeaceae archaeon]|jgi:hypothetical protein
MTTETKEKTGTEIVRKLIREHNVNERYHDIARAAIENIRTSAGIVRFFDSLVAYLQEKAPHTLPKDIEIEAHVILDVQLQKFPKETREKWFYILRDIEDSEFKPSEMLRTKEI